MYKRMEDIYLYIYIYIYIFTDVHIEWNKKYHPFLKLFITLCEVIGFKRGYKIYKEKLRIYICDAK